MECRRVIGSGDISKKGRHFRRHLLGFHMNIKFEIDRKRREEKKIAAMSIGDLQALNPEMSFFDAVERMAMAQNFVRALPWNSLQDELDARHDDPNYEKMSIDDLNERLLALGYKLDRSSDCRSNSLWMSGPRAGKSYPVVSMKILQRDDRKSAMHFEARRDANFAALQVMRGKAYVAGTKAIYEI